jgi:hypothetical protein
MCDAEAESLDLRVFVLDQSALSDHAKEHSAPDEVVTAYGRALAYVPLGDGVWLSGDLNANTFEVVCLTLRVDPSEIWFELLFTINCSDGFVRASIFVQALLAERAESEGVAG